MVRNYEITEMTTGPWPHIILGIILIVGVPAYVLLLKRKTIKKIIILLLFSLAGYGQIFIGVSKSRGTGLSESHQHLILLIGFIALAVSASIVLIQLRVTRNR
jgi:hypothetical protein